MFSFLSDGKDAQHENHIVHVIRNDFPGVQDRIVERAGLTVKALLSFPSLASPGRTPPIIGRKRPRACCRFGMCCACPVVELIWHDGWTVDHLTSDTMNNLLNIIIVLLVVGWLIGYIGFGTMVGSLIHVLLVLAVIMLVYRLLVGRKSI